MKKYMLFSFLGSILISSCNHYYYVSNVQNVPSLREKKEYRFSAAYGFGEESQSVEVQAAYAAGENLGLMAHFISARGGNVSDDYGRGTYFEGGLGYFKPMGKMSSFELFGGIGSSVQHHEYKVNTYSQGSINTLNGGKSDLSFIKFFLQPSLSMRQNIFDVSFSTRLSSVSFISITGYDNVSSYNIDELKELDNKSHFFMEPALTLRCGWKRIKVQIQGIYVGYLNNPVLYFGEPVHLSIGFSYALLK